MSAYPRINKRLAHIVVAERALGRAIPKGSPVHHVDEDITNYSNANLVICQDAAYHKLLHYRTRAYDATGNADAVKCGYCRKWTTRADPDLVVRENNNRYQNKFWHKSCKRDSNREAQRRIAKSDICLSCRKPYTAPTVRCFQCRNKDRLQRQQRIASGLCVICGQERGVSQTLKCAPCTTKLSIRWAHSKLRLKRMERRRQEQNKCQF